MDIDPTINRAKGNDSVEQHPTASEVLLDLAKQATVEAHQSLRKRSMVGQPSKTGAMNVKSMQRNSIEHVEREPRKRKVLWPEDILEICKDNPIKSNFQGINRVQRKLRTWNVKWCKVASETQ